MKKFKIKDNNKGNYIPNILDIWYQDNKIIAYVEGTYIYKLEIVLRQIPNTNKYLVKRSYCSCPKSDYGTDDCKHIEGVIKYLNKNNEVPLLETNNKLEKLDYTLEPVSIIKKLKKKIDEIIDIEEEWVSIYNSDELIDIMQFYNKYIYNYIINNNHKKAFILIINYLKQINKYNFYCEDHYDELVDEITSYLEELIDNYNYFNKVNNYINKKYNDTKIDKMGINILNVLSDKIENNKDKDLLLNTLNNIKENEYYEYEMNKIKDNIKNINKVI